MATISAKRMLRAAERAMNLTPGNAQSEESRDFFIRCGLSGRPEFLPNDCRLMNDVVAGNYPPAMTQGDIDTIIRINEMFEEACR